MTFLLRFEKFIVSIPLQEKIVHAIKSVHHALEWLKSRQNLSTEIGGKI